MTSKADLSLSVFTNEHYKSKKYTNSTFRNAMYDDLEINKSYFKNCDFSEGIFKNVSINNSAISEKVMKELRKQDVRFENM